jgi:hypothetical protein
VLSGKSLPTFLRNALPPSSGSRNKPCKWQATSKAYPAPLLGLLLTLKMKAVQSFEISVNFYQTTWHHIPEDSTIQRKRNLMVLHSRITFNVLKNLQWHNLYDEGRVQCIKVNQYSFRSHINSPANHSYRSPTEQLHSSIYLTPL